MTPTVIFFGSFGKYSTKVLQDLLSSSLVKVIGVITTPPFEKKGILIKNEVQILAQKQALPTFTPQNLDEKNITKLISASSKPDFIITAGYGKLLPQKLLQTVKINALNLHFSLLPKYKGANPGEWAILLNEKETGVSIIEMSEKFDTGDIIAQAKIPISPIETRETLYEKLYVLGGKLLPKVIDNFTHQPINPVPQAKNNFPTADKFKRAGGFVDWQAFEKAVKGKDFVPGLVSVKLQKVAGLLKLRRLSAFFLERAIRALVGFPGVWTIIPTTKGKKRMKIFSSSLEGGKLHLNLVQVEGRKKTPWREVKNILKIKTL